MELSLSLEQVIEFLLETPLFSELEPSELADIVTIMQVQRFRPEQPIFREGDDGNAWYVVFDGEAMVEKRDPFSPNRTVATLRAHACFGEMAILDDAPRSASVVAATDVTTFRFPSMPFQVLLEDMNVAAYKLIHAMARTLCKRQRNLNQQLTDMINKQDTDAQGLRSRVGPYLDESTISE